jgi:hypothetical protein
MKTYTTTIKINNVDTLITLSRGNFETLEALYIKQFTGLKSECIASLWDKGLLWSDCNTSGVKCNYEGEAFIKAFY